MKLSVLDFIPIYSHQTSAQAIAATLSLAETAESLGFYRYWITEHHNYRAGVSSCPSIILTHLANHTSRIRLGSGGVMLPNHSPLIVAEQYALLEAIAPNRIDLGIGRAPGADPVTAKALNHPDSPPEDLADDISLIIKTLTPSGARFVCDGEEFFLTATPRPQSMPDVWLLGSSKKSALVAARLGVPYAYAYHFSSGSATEALASYRDNFIPGYIQEPNSLITIYTVVADTNTIAEKLALPQLHNSLRIRKNVTSCILDVWEDAPSISDSDMELITDIRKKWIIGDVDTAATKINALEIELGIEEIMIVPVAAASKWDDPTIHTARVRSLELLAQKFL